jgi:hypothetical protein
MGFTPAMVNSTPATPSKERITSNPEDIRYAGFKLAMNPRFDVGKHSSNKQ